MSFAGPVLELRPGLAQERILLVRTPEAIRLCRDGSFERLGSQEISRLFDGMTGRDVVSLRSFVSRARLSPFPLSFVDDAKLLLLLRRAVSCQEVSAVRSSDAQGAGDDGLVVQRRLVRAIAAKSRGRLSHAGRAFRLVADVDLGRLPDRDRYEVVRNADAAETLQALAREPSTDPELAKLLGEASGKLTKDWRPPLSPDGLVLLRRIIVQQAVSSATEVVTPSQMKKLLTKTEWIEIVVKDELGQPYRGTYEIELPDGTTTTGNFDQEGLWGNYDIEPGNCKLRLPEVVEAVKPGAPPPVVEQNWIALKVVDQDGKPIVGRCFTLKLTDGTEHKGVTEEGEIRIEPLPAGTCIFSLAFEHAPAADVGETPASDDIVLEDETPGDGILDAIAEDAEGNPIVDHPFEARFPDGTVRQGRTDAAGKVHLEDCPGSSCVLRLLDSAAAL